jgi:hypothetical protein
MAVTKCLYILQTAPWACTIYMYHCSSIKIETFIYIVFYTVTVHNYKHCSHLQLQQKDTHKYYILSRFTYMVRFSKASPFIISRCCISRVTHSRSHRRSVMHVRDDISVAGLPGARGHKKRSRGRWRRLQLEAVGTLQLSGPVLPRRGREPTRPPPLDPPPPSAPHVSREPNETTKSRPLCPPKRPCREALPPNPTAHLGVAARKRTPPPRQSNVHMQGSTARAMLEIEIGGC